MPRPVYRLASETTSRRLASSRWFLARRAVLGDPLQVDALRRRAAPPLPSASFSSANRPGLDPLGQLDLLLGVEQRHLADLLEVVLDRVGGGAGRRDLRGGKILVVIAEDEDLLVLAGAVRGQLDHAGARRAGARGLGVRGRLARLGVLGVPRPVRYFRPVDVAGQIAGHLAEVGLAQVLLGQHGLQVGVVGVEIAEVDGIRVLQIRVSTEIRLAGVHRGQACRPASERSPEPCSSEFRGPEPSGRGAA